MEEINNLTERELPHSREAEQSVIGSILTSSESVSAAAEILKPDDFYFRINREIYSAALELFNENTPVDIVTVSDRLKMLDKLDSVGGIQYLSQTAVGVPTTQNVNYYAQIIKEKAVLRHLITSANAINEMAYGESGASDTIIEQAQQLIFNVAEDRKSSDIVPINDIIMDAYLDMVQNAENKGKLTGLDTGFDELNRRTGGFRGGELIIVGARPAMGKSSFVLNIAEHVAIETKKTVAVFNLEMSKNDMVMRILCSEALVDSHKMQTGDLTGDEWMQVGKIVDRVAMSPFYLDDTATITVSEIRAKCRRLKQSKDLALVVIDYLQLMNGSRTESRQQEISEISRSLKILAKELNVPVIALSQLARSSEAGSDKRPMLSHLRESGAIEQDADMVMFLYRDEYYNPDTEDKDIAECIIAKNRRGETGMFKLGWQGKYTKFLNIEYSIKEEA